MATVVCRGLQSCLDSHLVDHRTFIFPPFELPLKPPFSPECHILDSHAAGTPNSGGGTFLQPANHQEPVYVHPLAKRFNPTGLSEKSLKLCTENLGNETGSDIIENNIFSPEIQSGDLQRKGERKSHSHSNSHQFPPPLTTIRETESFRVKPRREEGRLIIAAVKTPARKSYFQAERSHGRLRLCFLKTEESEETDGADEELGDEMETNEKACAMMKEGNNGNANERLNLEQFSIATC